MLPFRIAIHGLQAQHEAAEGRAMPVLRMNQMSILSSFLLP
jgi:hypothetical protein